MKFTIGVVLIVATFVLAPIASGQVNTCPFTVPGTYDCSNDKPPCHQMKPYYYCNGTGNIKCCVESVNEIQRCGQVLSNASDVGECGMQCGNSGLVVEPINGRVVKVCLGPALYSADSKSSTDDTHPPKRVSNLQTKQSSHSRTPAGTR
jgi:hypothetical protein